MNAKQTKEAQRLVLVDEFNDQRAPDFTHNPLTAVDNKFAEGSAILKKAIKNLGGKAAIQASGAFGQQTEEKRTLRQDLEDEMRNYNRTAAAIAEATKNPGLMDRFRMPQGSGDGELKTKARAFTASDENGNPVSPDAVLDGMAGEFEAGEGSQGNALSTQAGATYAIPVHLREGKGAVKIFDAIYHNVYKDSAEMLGAWKTVSHVERTGTARKSTLTSSPSPEPEPADRSVRVTDAAPSNGAPSSAAALNAPSPNAAPSNGASATSNRTAPASA